VLSLEIVELIWAKGSEDFQDFPAVRPNALVALLKPAESPNPGLESVLSPKEEGFFSERKRQRRRLLLDLESQSFPALTMLQTLLVLD
jgi:hypothetical protein